MNAFISYSHQDVQMLDTLHKHLAQLQRERIITAWTDREILAGAELDKDISASLERSKLFLALLSPDYIASNYCYEKEFETALNMQEQGDIVVVPIIVEPCDWHNTPFSKFKALPKDGKAVSTWENKNTAFLDVIQNLRKLVSSTNSLPVRQVETRPGSTLMSRNYRVKKDFDSIEKLEFVDKTLSEVSEYLKRYMEEVVQLENIKARILNETTALFECLIVNRNKIDTEARVKISVGSKNQNTGPMYLNGGELTYLISNQNDRGSEKGFKLGFDEYHLFWTQTDNYFGSRNKKEFDSKEIADLIWNEWLEVVGIM